MDFIVRYEHSAKAHQYMSHIGVFVDEKLIVPEVKLFHELYFKDITPQQADAIKTTYDAIPDAIGVSIIGDVKPPSDKPLKEIPEAHPHIPKVVTDYRKATTKSK
jgi:hypothetical protein